MTVRIARTFRLPRWPLAAVLAGGLWAALGLTAAGLAHLRGVSIDLCPFHQLTGLPCPTCGTTRATFALLSGHPVEAWRLNPFMVTAGLVCGSLLIVRLLAGRAVRLEMTRRQRTAAGIALLALFAANWAYLLATLD